MPDNDKSAAIRYRFSGWNLPLHMWDRTGHSWAILPPHPYLRNQPLVWQDAWSFGKPAYTFITSVAPNPGTSGQDPDPNNGNSAGGKNDGVILPPRLPF